MCKVSLANAILDCYQLAFTVFFIVVFTVGAFNCIFLKQAFGEVLYKLEEGKVLQHNNEDTCFLRYKDLPFGVVDNELEYIDCLPHVFDACTSKDRENELDNGHCDCWAAYCFLELLNFL